MVGSVRSTSVRSMEPPPMGGRRHLAVCTGLALAVTPAVLPAQGTGASAAAESLIIRTDDIGMSHSVNMAMERLLGTGLPVSGSGLFVCPWDQEAVEVLKQHPPVAVGGHLALESEWQNYRLGAVAGRGGVPSL